MAYEPIQVCEKLRAILAVDAAFVAATPGGVHEDIAPPGTPAPYAIYQVMPGATDKTAGARTNAVVTLMVKVVSETGAGNAAGIVAINRIDALLESARYINAAGLPVCVEGGGNLAERTDAVGGATGGPKRYLKTRGRYWTFTVATL